MSVLPSSLPMPKKTAPDPDPDLKRLLEYQRGLAAFARTAGAVMPPERLMQHVTAQVSGLIRVKHVKVMRYRPDTGDLLIEAGVGWKEGVVGHVAVGGDYASPAGRAIQTDAPDVGFLSTCANILGLGLKRHDLESGLAEASAEQTRVTAQYETLMRELQHRVKNNFQVILSFLAMQRRHARDEDSRQRFATVMDRVHAIALANDQLRISDPGGSVEFADYLRALCANINPYQEGIAIEVEADASTVPLDRAVPAGLIVNELVTNSLKYAFGEDGGTIRVTFAARPSIGEGCLTVEDNGRGMPAASNGRRDGGLGLRLIEAFVQQLNGRLEREEVERGTKVRTCFPLAL